MYKQLDRQWLCSPSVRESDNVNTCFLIRFLVVSIPTHLPTPTFVCLTYRKKYTDLWKKVLGFHAKVATVKHLGASSGKMHVSSQCPGRILVSSSFSYLGAFVTKPLSIYHLARTWAVVAANSMVEELQGAQVPTLFFSAMRMCNIVSSCPISHFYRYADGTYGCR
jgi:hypothetical protein